jgi:hypothetical protein
MENLKLNFLEKTAGIPEIKASLDPIEEILDSFGKEIAEYAKGFFNYIVTTSSVFDSQKSTLIVNGASLYIIVPELGYDYKIFNLSYNNQKSDVTLYFYTLVTNQQEQTNILIAKNLTWKNDVESKIIEILNTGLADETFKFIVDRIKLKREANSEDS